MNRSGGKIKVLCEVIFYNFDVIPNILDRIENYLCDSIVTELLDHPVIANGDKYSMNWRSS